MKRLPLLISVAFVLATFAALAVGIGALESPKKIRVIYTNDLTGYLEPCG